jgi:hypothetical protein
MASFRFTDTRMLIFITLSPPADADQVIFSSIYELSGQQSPLTIYESLLAFRLLWLDDNLAVHLQLSGLQYRHQILP